MGIQDKITRRRFFKTSGLVGAAALLPTGRSTTGLLLKHLVSDEDVVPGVFYWLNSTCNECPAGCGVQACLINGNAVKIEGNKESPINRGGLCARGQSALENLYSPARVQMPMRKAANDTFEETAWSSVIEQMGQKRGAGKLVIIGRHITGAMRGMVDDLTAQLPNVEYLVYEPFDYSPVAAANRICFDINAIPVYEFDKAETIVSFGADFLETWLSPVGNAYGYSLTRNPGKEHMSRFVQFESHLSLTGANADDRFCVPPGGETLIALAIASEMLGQAAMPPEDTEAWRRLLKPFTVDKASKATGVPQEAIRKVISLLRSNRPGLAIAGGPASRCTNATALQIAVNLINLAAGSYGKTLTFDRTENAPVGTYQQISDLMTSMEAGEVSVLLVYDTVPEFALPSPERFSKAMANVPLKIKLSTVKDDTFPSYDIVLPVLDWLEVWDLVEPRSGILSVRQPVITPFTKGRHPGQALADLVLAWASETGQPAFDYEKLVESKWEKIQQATSPSSDFEDFWKDLLDHGGVWLEPTGREGKLRRAPTQDIESAFSAVSAADKPVLLPVTTVRYGDGRQTGRLWLNEFPDPITTIVWDNPLLISPALAKRWKCASEDVIKITVGNKSLQAPVYIQPSMHELAAAMPLGFASSRHALFHSYPGGNPLNAAKGETDAFSGSLDWTASPVAFEKVVGKIQLARTQGSFDQGPRRLAQGIPLNEAGKPGKPAFAIPPAEERDLYPPYEFPVHHWGMAIDLTACTGCGACAVACQAENNVLVVGKKQCLNGRQLSWLHIQRFSQADRTIFLPMLCQQCDHAPCEYVCPVYASVHNDEGLNLQVYNRCVGTRYCANNCPYKVRHFNWFTYTTEQPLEKQFNPRISIRTRGIMEKCTFCVQRIREQKELAKINNRSLQDGEIVPACAQSCPTRAIVFGDLNDPESEVSRRFALQRGYRVLEEVNTLPSVVYLKRAYHPESLVSNKSLEGVNER